MLFSPLYNMVKWCNDEMVHNHIMVKWCNGEMVQRIHISSHGEMLPRSLRISCHDLLNIVYILVNLAIDWLWLSIWWSMYQNKSILIVHPYNIEAGKLFGASHSFNFFTGVRYLCGYIGDKSKHGWIKDQTDK